MRGKIKKSYHICNVDYAYQKIDKSVYVNK